MNKGKVIVFSGPSGVGKNTVRKFFQNDKELNLAFSISMTTRKIRPGEVDGVDYHFVSQDAFAKAIQEGDLLEYAEFAGNYYGTPSWAVEKLRHKGKNVLLEIEVQGALQVMNKLKDEVSIFLIPPSIEDLRKRLETRGTETQEVINRRLAKATMEINLKQEYNHVVLNDEPQRAAKEIKNIILRA